MSDVNKKGNNKNKSMVALMYQFKIANRDGSDPTNIKNNDVLAHNLDSETHEYILIGSQIESL